MLRTSSVLAATAAMVAVTGGTALAVDPVDTVVRTVNKVAAGVDVPGGGEVIGGPGGIGGVRGGRSAVVGFVSMQYNQTLDAAPRYHLVGALADPNQWTCAGSGDGATYSVTCLPVSLAVPMSYHCDVLHADIYTSSQDGSGRTTLDCDSDGVGEAQTDVVTGVGGNDHTWAVDTRHVTAFTCTIDSGRPDWSGGCGDPGLVGVE